MVNSSVKLEVELENDNFAKIDHVSFLLAPLRFRGSEMRIAARLDQCTRVALALHFVYFAVDPKKWSQSVMSLFFMAVETLVLRCLGKQVAFLDIFRLTGYLHVWTIVGIVTARALGEPSIENVCNFAGFFALLVGLGALAEMGWGGVFIVIGASACAMIPLLIGLIIAGAMTFTGIAVANGFGNIEWTNVQGGQEV